MIDNRVKRTLSAGGVAVGTAFFEFGTPGVPALASAAGADFAFFDTEHSGWTNDTVRVLLRAAHGVGLPAFVRPAATQYQLLSQPLDLGAMGLIVPMVESREQAETIVRCTKYPPRGRRGAAFVVAHDDYLPGPVQEKMESANQEILLLPQIETAAGLAAVEEIAAVDGIDVLWVGQFDLTASMGIPGQFDHPRYHEALRRVVAAAEDRGKAAAFMATSPQEAEMVLSTGFRCIAYGGDLWLYQEALRAGVAATRDAAARVRGAVRTGGTSA